MDLCSRFVSNTDVFSKCAVRIVTEPLSINSKCESFSNESFFLEPVFGKGA